MLPKEYAVPVAIMGVGIPGSGKSTLLRPLAEEIGARYLCADDIREELTGNASDQTVNAKAWRLLHERATASLNKGISVVIDATHATRRQRKGDAVLYRQAGAVTVVAFVVAVEPEVAIIRNEGRDRRVPTETIHRMARLLQEYPVQPSEGFDDIIRITNDT